MSPTQPPPLEEKCAEAANNEQHRRPTIGRPTDIKYRLTMMLVKQKEPNQCRRRRRSTTVAACSSISKSAMANASLTMITVIAFAISSRSPSSCQAFPLWIQSHSSLVRTSWRRRYDQSIRRLSPEEHIDDENEAARKEFEQLVMKQKRIDDDGFVGEDDNDNNTNLNSNEEQRSSLSLSPSTSKDGMTTGTKPLTASSRRVRELEMLLLQGLVDSDDPLDPLVDLWMKERADAADQLKAMETSCSPGLRKEEEQLRQMIDQYGTDWTEPMSRFALLLFTKGSRAALEESKSLCRIVMSVKPWHFETSQLLVAILLRQGDFQQALKTTRIYCLPPLNERTDNKRRRQWVQNNLTMAREEFYRAHMATVSVRQDDAAEDLCSLETEGEFCWQ